MRTPLLWMALALGALPLLAPQSVAQQPQRRVVAPCTLTAASLIASGKESETEGRQFVITVTNNSKRTIALPRLPIFGWRVEVLDRKVWRLKAEGGPVRRVNDHDAHIEVLGTSPATPLLEIAPAHSEDYYTFLPEAEKALLPTDQLSTLKLTLYWAAPAALAHNNPAIPLCALAPQWVSTMQKLASK